MAEIKTIKPIFWGKTKSFFLGVLPLIITGIDAVFGSLSAGGDGGPLVQIIVSILGIDPAQAKTILMALSPVWGLIIMHQRRGLNRPYVSTPAAENDPGRIVEVVLEGKAAFDQGRVIGESIKDRLRPK